MNLTASEKSLIIKELIKSENTTNTKMLALLKEKENKPSIYLDEFAQKYKAVCDVYARSKLSVRGNNVYSELRKELKTLPRLNPYDCFLVDAKSKDISHLKPLFAADKKLSNIECLVIYTNTKKHCGRAFDAYEIGRNFLTQESLLVSLARKYCQSIGMKVW